MTNKDNAANNENKEKNELSVVSFFSAPVYVIEKPEFLKSTRKVVKRSLAKRKGEVDLNPVYPVYMTENLNYEPEMLEFANFVAQTAWDILFAQGYAMDNFNTYFESMWCQEHHATSSMEKHIHGNGVLMTGFYFLDCPKDATRAVFHDPRDAKVITSLPERNALEATHASNMINVIPKEGVLMFSNSWLPHSFTKNQSNKPVRFIHFNVAVAPAKQQNTCSKPTAEVI